ncbi:hypothetical protein AB1F57_01675 [Streptococcus sp. ZY1909104]|uniref:hypothetical protein n=1 Tax=Streptococcus sp. ZY1909104 TaxID=3233335 RepID=UPI00349FA29D
MKKTVWNASLEESLNLVTDKYIQTSLEDIEKNGYKKKILGFLTVEFFMFLFSFIGPYSDKEVGNILFVEAKILFSIPVWLGLLVIVHYLIVGTAVFDVVYDTYIGEHVDNAVDKAKEIVEDVGDAVSGWFGGLGSAFG